MAFRAHAGNPDVILVKPLITFAKHFSQRRSNSEVPGVRTDLLGELPVNLGFSGGSAVKNHPANQETGECGFAPWVREIP